jgi:hypothetical protein
MIIRTLVRIVRDTLLGGRWRAVSTFAFVGCRSLARGSARRVVS